MKHLKDAQKLLDEGDGVGALEIVNNLLELAPRNTEALRIKARILDAWGHFDASFELLRQISHLDAPSDDAIADLEERLREEREAMIFSEITQEGRWYFALPKAQVWVSVYGFVGCAAFLLLSSQWIDDGTSHFTELAIAFVALVVAPWVALMVVHFTGVKKILVGLEGIRICKRFAGKTVRWSQLRSAVIEYDTDVNAHHLKLFLYGEGGGGEPLAEFNISQKNCIVRARRHFVRNVLTYVDCVTYRARHAAVAMEMPSISQPEPVSGTATEQNKAA